MRKNDLLDAAALLLRNANSLALDDRAILLDGSSLSKPEYCFPFQQKN